MLTIDSQLSERKAELLEYFRERAAGSLEELRRTYGTTDRKRLAQAINSAVTLTRTNLLTTVLQIASEERWPQHNALECVLMITYSSYVAMLEYRNEVWPYEYMTFGRRMGELWEPFCKLCFDYSVNNIRLFIPPLFSDVKRLLNEDFNRFIETLNLTRQELQELQRYFDKVWAMVDAGQINLELDLHFLWNNEKIVIDFKSGFGSNEKGNTNRLLLVGSIYKNLEDNYRCVMLVRSDEDKNNNYFQVLRRSSIWEAYCGREAYGKIGDYTGFDLTGWVQRHIDWEHDFQASTMRHLADNQLDDYLKW